MQKSIFLSYILGVAILLSLVFSGSAHAVDSLASSTLDGVVSTRVHIKKPNKKPVVIIVPHQDDELFMAGAIQRYVASGRRVYAVMVSDGGGSYARHKINGKDDRGNSVCCGLDGEPHEPKKEGYWPLSRKAFSAARNREFMRSMARLGVPAYRIIYMNGSLHGTSTPRFVDMHLHKNASQVISSLYARFGDGTYVTVAGGHSDHVALEEALSQAKRISEKVFFPFDPSVASDNLELTPEELLKKQNAVAEYEAWNPRKGKYAIGAHSVPDLIATWKVTEREAFYTIVE